MRPPATAPMPGDNRTRREAGGLLHRLRRGWAMLLSLALVTALLSAAPATATAPASQAPVADAGPDQSIVIGQTVTLDGTGSSDPDGDELSYDWTLTGPQPGNYTQSLDDTSSATPSFTPALTGVYTATLVVSDGTTDSVADSVAITVGDGIEVDWICDGVTVTAPVRITRVTVAQGEEQSRHIPRASTWTLDDTPGITSIWVSVPGNDGGEGLGLGTRFDAPADSPCAPVNEPPVAEAGPDQDATTGDTVTLDGTASTDPDDDPLTYAWTLTSPDGSTATLSDASAAQPYVIPDLPGEYVASLIVNDGTEDSPADTTTITVTAPANQAPVAQAQVISVTDRVVQLDGSGSSDPDGDDLTYAWTLTGPDVSTAVLDDATAAQPSFTADVTGTYTATLIVNDGTDDSPAASAQVTIANRPPVADAGPDQDATTGDTVTLDGTASTDPDGDSLTYAWTLASPDGSTAELVDSASAQPSFVPDVAGDYTAELTVNDGTEDSTPDTTAITVTAPANQAPVADAGPDQDAMTGDTVTLDGSGSTDPDGDEITYAWTVTDPAGAAVTLSDATAERPQFSASGSGFYTASLIVTDEWGAAGPADSSLITVRPELSHKDVMVGLGLQTDLTWSFDDDLPAPVDVTVTVGDESVALVSTSHTIEGAKSIILEGAGRHSLYNVQVQGVTAGTTPVTVSAPGYPDTTATITVTSAVGFSFGYPTDDIIIDETAGEFPLVLHLHMLDADGNQESRQGLRPGADPVTVQLTNTDDGVGTVSPSAVEFRGGDSNQGFTHFVPAHPGTTTIDIVQPPGFTAPADRRTSLTATVTGPPNQAPVADAGEDQTAMSWERITLDGTGSTDPDGDELTYAWTLTPPDGSTVVLDDPTAEQPQFSPYGSGYYTATLTVTDPWGATSPTDSVTITVLPIFSVGDVTVGKDLQTDAGLMFFDQLPEPVDITVTISDESVAVVSADPEAVGGKTLTLEDVTAFDFALRQVRIQGLAAGSTTATVTATGYPDSTSTITVVPDIGFSFGTDDFVIDESAEDLNVWVDLHPLDANGNLLRRQGLRAGVDPVTLPLANSDDTVGTLTQSSLHFAADNSNGHTQFDPGSPGTTQISFTQPPGFTEPANGRSSITATVTPPPEISIGDATVGKDLQAWVTADLSHAPTLPTDVTVTVGDASIATLSIRGDQAGSETITINDVTGMTTGGFVVQGLAQGSTTMTVSAPGWPDATADITITGSGFYLPLGDAITAANSADVTVYVFAVALEPDGSVGARQGPRGGTSVPITLTNSNDTVGTLDSSELVYHGGDGHRVQTMFDPHAVGTSVVTLTQPEGFTTPTNGKDTQAFTIVEPQVLLDDVIVGADEVSTATIRLTEAPALPTDLWVTVDNPWSDGELGVPPERDPIALISFSPDGPWENDLTLEGVTDASGHTIYVKGVRADTVDFRGGSWDHYGALATITVPPTDPPPDRHLTGALHPASSPDALPSGVRWSPHYV